MHFLYTKNAYLSKVDIYMHTFSTKTQTVTSLRFLNTF